MNIRCYCRYSPRRGHCDSIETQSADLAEYAAKNKHTIVAVYSDADLSGTVPFLDRPGLSKCLSDLKRGEGLLIRNLARGARDLGVSISIEAEVFRRGAVLIIVEEGGLQPSMAEDPSRWAMRRIKDVMNVMERLSNNARTSRRMKQHQTNGRLMGSVAPFGWRIVTSDQDHKKHLAAVAREQKIMRFFVAWSASMTPGQIARRLNEYPELYPPRGDKWYPNSVRRAIKRAEALETVGV